MATQVKALEKQDLEKMGYEVLEGPFQIIKGPALMHLLFCLAGEPRRQFSILGNQNFKILGNGVLLQIWGMRALNHERTQWLIEGHFGQASGYGPESHCQHYWLVAQYYLDCRSGTAFITKDPRLPRCESQPKKKKRGSSHGV